MVAGGCTGGASGPLLVVPDWSRQGQSTPVQNAEHSAACSLQQPSSAARGYIPLQPTQRRKKQVKAMSSQIKMVWVIQHDCESSNPSDRSKNETSKKRLYLQNLHNWHEASRKNWMSWIVSIQITFKVLRNACYVETVMLNTFLRQKLLSYVHKKFHLNHYSHHADHHKQKLGAFICTQPSL